MEQYGNAESNSLTVNAKGILKVFWKTVRYLRVFKGITKYLSLAKVFKGISKELNYTKGISKVFGIG